MRTVLSLRVLAVVAMLLAGLTAVWAGLAPLGPVPHAAAQQDVTLTINGVSGTGPVELTRGAAFP